MDGAALSGVQIRILAVVPVPERNLLRGLTRNIRSCRAVRAFKIQLLGSKQGTAALGCLTHDGGNKLVALVAVVTPHLNNIIFFFIQGVCRNLRRTVDVAALVSESQILVVIFNDVANHQNRGVQTHLSHNNLNTLRGVKITLKPPTPEVQNLILISILQRVVAQVRIELIRSISGILADAITRQRTSRCRNICSSILGKRRSHRQNNRTRQRQCTAAASCIQE